jgi:hypothetical protein
MAKDRPRSAKYGGVVAGPAQACACYPYRVGTVTARPRLGDGACGGVLRAKKGCVTALRKTEFMLYLFTRGV